MAYHASLVDVDRVARLQFLHVGEGALDERAHLGEEILAGRHAAEVEGEGGRAVAEKLVLERGPVVGDAHPLGLGLIAGGCKDLALLDGRFRG